MYTRSKSFKNKDGSSRTYLYLVDSKRVNGKILQKNVACLGRLDSKNDLKSLEKIAAAILKYTRTEALLTSPEVQLSFESAYELGPILLFKRFWDDLKLDSIFRKHFKDNEKSNLYIETLFMIVLNRLCDPQSKLGVSRWIESVYRESGLELTKNHFYEALDEIIHHKEAIEEDIFDNMKSLFNMEVDIVLTDTTSIRYFGGKHAPSARYGYSKEKRSDLKQFILALIVTKEGLPIAHQLFPGNTADKSLFIPFITKAKRRFHLGKVIMVEDSGFYSEEIHSSIKALGCEYIIKSPLSGDRKDFATSEHDWVVIQRDKTTDKALVKACERKITDDREILIFSEKRAEDDRYRRDQLIKHLNNHVEGKSLSTLIKNKGYKKYIRSTKEKVEINTEKIALAEALDGKYILRTNSDNSIDDIYLYYKQLHKVEESFRYLKSPLETDPLYHWLEHRIEAHVMLCVLAYLLEMMLIPHLRELQKKLNYPEFLHDLRQLKVSKMSLDGKSLVIRNEAKGIVSKLFSKLQIALPPRLKYLN